MIAKLLTRLVILVVALLISAPFVLGPSYGGKFLTVDEVKAFDVAFIASRYGDTFSYLATKIRGEMDSETLESLGGEAPVTKLYRWKDEQGEWHFSDTVPDGVMSEELEIENNKNVMTFEDVKRKKEEEQQQAEE